MPQKMAYSMDEAASILGLSYSTVRNLMATGRLGYTTAINRVLIPHTAIEDFLASPPERPIKPHRPKVAK